MALHVGVIKTICLSNSFRCLHSEPNDDSFIVILITANDTHFY